MNFRQGVGVGDNFTPLSPTSKQTPTEPTQIMSIKTWRKKNLMKKIQEMKIRI